MALMAEMRCARKAFAANFANSLDLREREREKERKREREREREREGEREPL